MVGRGPGAEKCAVGLEDLDASGLVDDIELIVAVDGNGAGRLEATIRDARPSSDRLDATDTGLIVVAAGNEEQQRQKPAGRQEARSTEYRVPSTKYLSRNNSPRPYAGEGQGVRADAAKSRSCFWTGTKY